MTIGAISTGTLLPPMGGSFVPIGAVTSPLMPATEPLARNVDRFDFGPLPVGAVTGPTGYLAQPQPNSAYNSAMLGANSISIGAGGATSDAELVAGAFNVLRQSQAGAAIADQMVSVGARIAVLSDADFVNMGEGTAHAFYDPNIDTIYLRRSDLQRDTRFAALEIAHEGVHLLDDKGQVGAAYFAQARAAATTTQAYAQYQFERTMIYETRAFTYTGLIARDLGLTLGNDPTGVAATGNNDAATYARVWNTLLGSSYNRQGHSAPVRFV